MENTKLRMEQYQRENRDIIHRNKAKLVYMTLYTHFMFMSLKQSFGVKYCSFLLCFPDVTDTRTGGAGGAVVAGAAEQRAAETGCAAGGAEATSDQEEEQAGSLG